MSEQGVKGLHNMKLKCKDCGNEFLWLESEQKFFKLNNLLQPKRCKKCRLIKKQTMQRLEAEGKFKPNAK